MGLQLLEREKLIFEKTPEVQPDFTGNEYILQRQLKPKERKIPNSTPRNSASPRILPIKEYPGYIALLFCSSIINCP